MPILYAINEMHQLVVRDIISIKIKQYYSLKDYSQVTNIKLLMTSNINKHIHSTIICLFIFEKAKHKVVEYLRTGDPFFYGVM